IVFSPTFFCVSKSIIKFRSCISSCNPFIRFFFINQSIYAFLFLCANVSPLPQNTAVLSSAILITLAGMMLHIHFVKVDHETLLVVGSLGIQVSSSYASGREVTTFIEMSRIKDIVINEAHQIIYYLCVLLKEPSEPNGVSSVVTLFQSSKPRLNCLVKVYKSCQEILSTCQ
uniref:Phosphatidylinositol glycan anchor biosynthesis, class H n=1 Tax=Fundulus heteroclitus TaxID=8078 RepID=A0A3Q2NWC7_FUNHE